MSGAEISASNKMEAGEVETNFDRSMAFVFSVEGGYSDDANDPGGITNHGITIAEWQLYVGQQMLVDDGVMRALTEDDVRPLYHSHYWLASRCQDLPAGVDLMVMDASVNTGCGRSIRSLQTLVGPTAVVAGVERQVAVDGIMGPVTLAAVAQMDPVDLISRLASRRLAFYQGLPTWPDFGHGWSNRITLARSAALNLIGGASS